MLIYQPSVLIPSALCLLDLSLSQLFPPPLSSFHKALSDSCFSHQHFSPLNFCHLQSYLSFLVHLLFLFLFSLFSLLAHHFTCAELPLFSCFDIPPGLTFGMSTLTLICFYRRPLQLCFHLFSCSTLILSDSIWVEAKLGGVSSLKGVCLLPFPPRVFLLSLFASFSYFFLLPFSPWFREQPPHMVIYNSAEACLQNKQHLLPSVHICAKREHYSLCIILCYDGNVMRSNPPAQLTVIFFNKL